MLNQAAWDTREFRLKHEPGCAELPPLYPSDEASKAAFTARGMVYATQPVTDALAAFTKEVENCGQAAEQAHAAGLSPGAVEVFWTQNRQRVIDALDRLSSVIRAELRVVRER
jgi:hypothetical protein